MADNLFIARSRLCRAPASRAVHLRDRVVHLPRELRARSPLGAHRQSSGGAMSGSRRPGGGEPQRGKHKRLPSSHLKGYLEATRNVIFERVHGWIPLSRFPVSWPVREEGGGGCSVVGGAAREPRPRPGDHPGSVRRRFGVPQAAFRGNHLSNTTCLTHVFSKSGE